MALWSFSPLTYGLGLLALAFSTALFMLVTDIAKWRRMPPGPTPLPFIGNNLDLPKKAPWIKFQEWSKRYGPIYTVWIGRRPTVIVSDPNVAVELLEKRSIKYSSRPRMVVMGEIYWDMASVLVQPYGKEWQVRRRLLHQALTPSALRLYKPIQEAEASRLVYGLLDSPSVWEKSFERFTASIVFSIAYGHRIDSLESETILQRMRFMHFAASLNVPGKYLVESLPFLKHVPNVIAPWKTAIQEMGYEEASVNMALVDDVKQDIAHARATGEEAPASLTKLLLDAQEKQPVPLSERDFSFIPASLFGAGADTTASTLCSAMLAFITHPHALKKAQEELDTVIGRDRTPNFNDEANLPYVRALVKEVLRWRPVAVLGGTPHASTEDDVYEGYYIPAGTTVLGNTWAINLNEEYYPNPHVFDPSRFLGLDAAGDKPGDAEGRSHPSKSGHSSFGWGRRICPGADLAANSLFIALSKIMWAYDISPIKGRQYDIFAYTDGFNIRPQTFQCEIKVRSDAHRAVLSSDMKQAERFLEKFSPFEKVHDGRKQARLAAGKH
ncbi:MAG: hypothetical protein M4579_001992 [Chaenotheca gracillima]|nr:MAG: hypothetical protein M4579_001992 [Chaenotheca gracillima]